MRKEDSREKHATLIWRENKVCFNIPIKRKCFENTLCSNKWGLKVGHKRAMCVNMLFRYESLGG